MLHISAFVNTYIRWISWQIQYNHGELNLPCPYAVYRCRYIMRHLSECRFTASQPILAAHVQMGQTLFSILNLN